MKSLLRHITGNQPEGDAPGDGFPQAVANSVHSLFQRLTGQDMPPEGRDRIAAVTLPSPSGTSPEVSITTASAQELQGFSSAESSPTAKEHSTAPAYALSKPETPTKSSRTGKSQAAKQNARRDSRHDPLQRYFSRAHSFPDYGHLKPNDKMGNFLKAFNNAYSMRPVNTLDPARPQPLPVVSRRTPDRLSSKRQRTDDSGSYTPVGFALIPTQDIPDTQSKDRLSKTGHNGSQSVASTEEKNTLAAPVVDEYRKVEALHKTGRTNRYGRSRLGRSNRNGLVQFRDDYNDPIQDFGDEDLPDGSSEDHRSGRGRQQAGLDSADFQILGTARSAAGQNHYAHTMDRHRRKRLGPGDVIDEPDELASDPSYNGNYPNKKHNSGRQRQHPEKSSSISTRGDMKPSLASDPRSRAPPELNIRLRAAVWKPSRVYEKPEGSSPDDSPHVRLMSTEVLADGKFPTKAVLTLISTFEDGPKYEWFLLESAKIQRVKINYESCVVMISGPAKPDLGLGAQLYLQLDSEKDTKKLGSWIQQYSNVELHPDNNGTLCLEFEKTLGEVKKRAMPKADVVEPSRPQATPWGAGHFDDGAVRSTTQRSTRRMIDSMGSSSGPQSAKRNRSDDEDSIEEARPRRGLRSRRDRSSPTSTPLLERWSETNPDWDKNWRVPLTFHRTIVNSDDIPRLDEGQCLNDAIIGFYLKYLQVQAEQQRPELAKRVYFHNSFFYTKLKPEGSKKIDYQGVKNWTSKVDLFSYDYIVVPVNEHFHWWVAIICNPGKLGSAVAEQAVVSPSPAGDPEDVLPISSSAPTAVQSSPQEDTDVIMQDPPVGTTTDEKTTDYKLADPYELPDSEDGLSAKAAVSAKAHVDAVVLHDDATPVKREKKGRKGKKIMERKYNPGDPRIVTLDSLGMAHSPVCSNLKNYLIEEFKDKKGKTIEYNQTTIGMRATRIPEQNNFCDCGVYLLGYVAEFLRDPDNFTQGLLQREDRQWDFDASEMRNKIRQLIFELQEPQQKQADEAKRLKALAKREKERSKSKPPVDSSPVKAAMPVVSAERADSPVKVPVAVPSAAVASEPVASATVKSAPVSRSPSAPIADRLTSPQALAAGSATPDKGTLLKTPLAAQLSKSSQIAQVASQYEPRKFDIIEVPDSQEAAKQAIPRPQSSQPLQSIEIPDDDVLARGKPTPSPEQKAVNGVKVVLVTDTAPDEDEVELVSAPTPSTHVHSRKNSKPPVAMSAASFYRPAHQQPAADGKDASKTPAPAKPVTSSSATPNKYPGLQISGKELTSSPHFTIGPPPVKQQQKPKKTYGGSGRKTSKGGTIDLTDD